MNAYNWKARLRSYDNRRDIASPGDAQATIQYSIEHFLAVAQEAIDKNGVFNAALSGGSTPKLIFEGLSSEKHRHSLDWKKVNLYWSDERCVPPYDTESNYRMAMDAGFAKLSIPPENIHRMQAEGDVEEGALAYEHLIQSKIADCCFDLVMLGMGEDGHTASLFPKTHALHSQERLVVANYIPQKDVWRMTLTFKCINAAKHIAIYVLGKSKGNMLQKVLQSQYDPDVLPIQGIGTPSHKALWIADDAALSVVTENSPQSQ